MAEGRFIAYHRVSTAQQGTAIQFSAMDMHMLYRALGSQS